MVVLSELTARKVLKDLAFLDKLKVDSRADSATIAGLTLAYHYKDSALNTSLEAKKEADGKAEDFRSLYIECGDKLSRTEKEVRKQKVLKWAGFGLAGIMAILGASH